MRVTLSEPVARARLSLHWPITGVCARIEAKSCELAVLTSAMLADDARQLVARALQHRALGDALG